MKVWLDLSNSPHPLLFAPVACRLQSNGDEVLVTARDNAQTVQLARERWPEVVVIGGESPRGRAAKLTTLKRRVTDLRRWAVGLRPDVALSHNSYAQIVVARSLGIPAVTAMDFEHQPANHLAFRLATRVIAPEVLPEGGFVGRAPLPERSCATRGSRSSSILATSPQTRTYCRSSGFSLGRGFSSLRVPRPAAPFTTALPTRFSKMPSARFAPRRVLRPSLLPATPSRSP